jgi:hypothetical protein
MQILTTCWRLIPVASALEQSPQFSDREAGVSQNATERSLGDVTAGMDRHSSATTVRMPHDVVAACYPRHLEPGFLQRAHDLIAA